MKARIIIAVLTLLVVLSYVGSEMPAPIFTKEAAAKPWLQMKLEVCDEWIWRVHTYCARNEECLKAQEGPAWNDCLKLLANAIDSAERVDL